MRDHRPREVEEVVKAREFEAVFPDINKLLTILEKVVLIHLRGDVLESFVEKFLKTLLVLQDLLERGFFLSVFSCLLFLV